MLQELPKNQCRIQEIKTKTPQKEQTTISQNYEVKMKKMMKCLKMNEDTITLKHT